MRGMRLRSIALHRNGVFGEGFHVVAFFLKQGGRLRPMVATVFSTDEQLKNPDLMSGKLTVLDADLAAEGKISSTDDNQWDGPAFEPQLRAWMAQHWEDQERRLALAFASAEAA